MKEQRWETHGDRFKLNLANRSGLLDWRSTPPGLIEQSVAPDAPIWPGPMLAIERVYEEDTRSFGQMDAAEVRVRSEAVDGEYRLEDSPIRLHAYWRATPQHVDLEVLLAIPKPVGCLGATTVSCCPVDDILGLDGDPLPVDSKADGIGRDVVGLGWMVRPAGLEVSYAEVARAGECHRLRWNPSSSGSEVRFDLFGQGMEKGVILRGLIRSLVVDRANDVFAIQQAARQLESETPQLSV